MVLTAPFYFLIVVALAVLLTTAFRRLREDGNSPSSLQQDKAFERRIARIEKRFGPPAPDIRDVETDETRRAMNEKSRD